VLLADLLYSRTFAIETGCPPPELLVTVSITSGIFFAPLLDHLREPGRVHISLNG